MKPITGSQVAINSSSPGALFARRPSVSRLLPCRALDPA